MAPGSKIFLEIAKLISSTFFHNNLLSDIKSKRATQTSDWVYSIKQRLVHLPHYRIPQGSTIRFSILSPR
jgi:hypothetical protein